MIDVGAVKYELADKVRGVANGGVGLMLRVAREVGLVEALDRRVQLLKRHVPYHESDHVLNFAINAWCNATCLQDIELRRNDEVFLDSIGADALPDPTTAGDFCRRFDESSLRDLHDAIDDARLNVWKRQSPDFFDEVVVDMDGTLVVTVRKNISREQGGNVLFDEVHYFFYITNDRTASAEEIVFGCNDRCDQENLIAQLAAGVRALSAPVDNLISNGASMVMTSLAWTLKSWAALLLPVEPRWREQHQAARRTLLTMEFKTFLNTLVKIPCQIVKTSRRVIYRVLAWNPHLPCFFRLCAALHC